MQGDSSFRWNDELRLGRLLRRPRPGGRLPRHKSPNHCHDAVSPMVSVCDLLPMNRQRSALEPIADIPASLNHSDMETENMGMTSTNGCMWGCVTLLLLGLGLLFFGRDVVGTACLVLGPASVLGQGLRTGRFGWIFSGGELRREANSLGFWLVASALAAITALSLFLFVDEVRRLAS